VVAETNAPGPGPSAPRSLEGRLVDLSHTLYPGKEEYSLELETHFTDELYPQYKRSTDTWYILQNMHMSSHCGTHIEFPYHHCRTGMDAGSFPLDRLVGDGLRLDYRHKKPGDMVTLQELRAIGSRIRAGDMVLFDFDCARFYRTPRSHDRPSIAHDAIQWLVEDRKINLIGTDASGIELKGVPDQPNHQFLMDHGVPIIEFAANLDRLRVERFTLFVLALPVVGLDSCPVRLLALEPPEVT
jgi:arylformamidase